MDIEYLRQFAHLVGSCSFTQTAHVFHITQSTLSKHISSMESELGVRLFDRSTTMVRPTTSGLIFLEGCLESLKTFDASAEMARNALNDKHRTLKVGGYLLEPNIKNLLWAATRQIGLEGLSLRIERYEDHLSEYFPNMVKLNVFDLLTCEKLDILLLIGPDEFLETEGLCACKVGSLPLACLAHKENAITSEGELSFKDFENETFVRSPYYGYLHRRIDEIAQMNGFTPRTKVLARNSSLDLILDPQKHDLFLFTDSPEKERLLGASPQLVEVKISDPLFRIPVYLIMRDSANVDIRRFSDCVKKAAKENGVFLDMA